MKTPRLAKESFDAGNGLEMLSINGDAPIDGEGRVGKGEPGNIVDIEEWRDLTADDADEDEEEGAGEESRSITAGSSVVE